MDAVDQAILRRLQRDGRQTNRELAEALGIAPSTALERTRALPRAAWPALLAASAATATFQGTFLTSAARTGAAVATAVTFGIVPVSTGLCERIVLGAGLPRRWVWGTAGAIAGCVLISVPQGAGAGVRGRAGLRVIPVLT